MTFDLDRYLQRLHDDHLADKARYETHNPSLCMLCGAYGADKRSVTFACGYRVQEAVPEFIDLQECGEDVRPLGNYLLVCKSCRTRLLGHLREWANECRDLRERPKDHDGNLEDLDPILTEGLVCVRIDGAITYITVEEWERRCTEQDDA